ncbi:MAG: class I SAM-dependent methyltransferase [Anaerolineales bacterium]|nr:class I SAM-dependent methyltransferase [Anaerolineales bacterium]
MMQTTNFPEIADIETSSEDYARRFAGHIGAWFLEVQAEATLAMLKPYPRATILDVGGGHGQLTPSLISNGYNVTVLGSAVSCQKRIEDLVARNLCTFKVGNILNLPYPDKAFDVVISYRLLPHVQQWKPYLSELARLARLAIILDYPEIQSINYIAPYLFKYKKQLEGNTRPFTCFKKADLLQEFQALGFVEEQIYPEFFVPMVIHRKLKSVNISSALENVSRSLGLTYRFGSPVILKVIRQKG